MIRLNNILNEVISEGGAGGHMAHPFDFANTGAKLVDVFAKSVKSLKQGGGSVKVGQAPTGDIYDELRKVGYTLPKRRETNFSLLG